MDTWVQSGNLGRQKEIALGSNPRRQKETKFVNTAGELIIGIRKKD